MTVRASGERRGPIGLFVIAFLLGIAYVAWLASGESSNEPTPTAPATIPTTIPVAQVGPTRTLRPTRTPQATQTPEISAFPSPVPRKLKVGVVAGHWQHDPGAVCPDGLQEAEINLDIASRVVAILQHRGYDAELLPEFTDKLHGYKADTFLSIHADSCEVPGVSGFKVARLAASAIPEEEDRLVACLSYEYAIATGLPFHRDSITFDMTDYHAFQEIDPQTPGAIIELGFMDADRDLLTEQSSQVALAVVQGIICFLEEIRTPL